MARKTVKAAEQSQPADTRTDEEKLAAFFQEAKAAKKIMDGDAATARISRGVYREVFARAKKAGIAKGRLTAMIQISEREPEEVGREWTQTNRDARTLGISIPVQLGLWDDGRSVATHVDNDRAGTQKGKVRRDGAGNPKAGNGSAGSIDDRARHEAYQYGRSLSEKGKRLLVPPKYAADPVLAGAVERGYEDHQQDLLAKSPLTAPAPADAAKPAGKNGAGKNGAQPAHA